MRCAPRFVLQPTFFEYLAKVSQTVHVNCPSCDRRICLACGEDDVGNGGSFDAEGVDKGKGKAKESTEGPVGLFHCSKLQGVVLGVGASSSCCLAPGAAADSRRPPALSPPQASS